MKKYFMFFIVFVIFMCPSFGFGLTLDKTELLHDPGTIYFKTIITSDNNYLSIGMSFYEDDSFGVPIGPKIIKYDKNGNVLWFEILEEYDFCGFFVEVYEETNGDIVLVGSAYDPTLAIIVKFDKNGNLLWDTSSFVNEEGIYYFIGSFNDLAKFNDDYIAVGQIGNGSVYKGYFTIYDTNGNRNYYKYFESNVFSTISNIEVVDNDEFILFGQCSLDSSNVNNKDICITKYNTNFDVIWNTSYGGNKNESITNLVKIGSNKYRLFIRSKEIGDSVYSYSVIDYDANGNKVYERSIPSLYNFDVNEFYLTDDEQYIATGCQDTSCGIGLFDSNFNMIAYEITSNSNTKQILGVVSKSISSSKKYILNEGTIDSGNIGQKAWLDERVYEISFNYNVTKIPSHNGTFDVELDGDLGIVSVVPNPGFEIFKVVVEDTLGNNIDVTKRNGKYYFETKTDVYVNVLFKKINNNSEYTLFKKGWEMNHVYVTQSDVYNETNLLSGFGEYLNNKIYYFYHKEYENGFKAEIDILDSNSNVINKLELDNQIVIDIKSYGDDLYVFLLDFLDSGKSLSIRKYNGSLELVKELKNIGEFINFGFFFESYLLCNVDYFKIYNNELYVLLNDELYVYDLNLVEKRTTSSNDEICGVLEHVCMLFNIMESGIVNDVDIITGFDKNSKYTVLSGYVSFDGDQLNQSVVKLYDQNNNLIFNKRIEKYENVFSVILYNSYIVGIGYWNSIDNGEIFIMDLKGNIIHTINDKYMYFKLEKISNSFLTLGLSYEDESKCELSIDDFYCSSVSLNYYYLAPKITLGGEDGSRLIIPDDIKTGETINVEVEGKFGYTFEGLKITDANGNVTIVNGKSFVMPDTAVQIEPIFSPIVNPDTGTFISISVVILSLIGLFSYYFLKKVKVKKFST